MGLQLSKYFFLPRLLSGLFLLVTPIAFSQNAADDVLHPKDYKDQGQFKHFYKRREAISRWQINQLKNGALLIRLHENKLLIDGLKKRGQNDLATLKEQEAFAINKNIMRAFLKNYNFSKVYFFYSSKSDTIMNGARSGVFLDTNLAVDPSIKMDEKFYLLGEKDYIFSSSIGYVKEDTAKFVKEVGNASKEMGVILKNKYGHQLKDPFPYYEEARGSLSAITTEYYNFKGITIKVELPKRYSSIKFQGYVLNFNAGLHKFYNANKGYEVTDEDIKPFLY